MSKEWSYTSGDWLILCDVCNKKIKASESKKRWDGFVVCAEDFEMRHPQDFIRVRSDKISVPFTRPRTTDVFTDVPYISIYVENDYTEVLGFGINRQTYFEETQ